MFRMARGHAYTEKLSFCFVAKSGHPATSTRRALTPAAGKRPGKGRSRQGEGGEEGITQSKKKKHLSPPGMIYYFKKSHFSEIF